MEEGSSRTADQAGTFSVARPLNAWYPACRSVELAKQPLAAVICDTPLCLFRDEHGKPTALLDRCAHRNVPLSGGRIVGSEIECAYHGWRYDAGGICRRVPALSGDPEGKARRVRCEVITIRSALRSFARRRRGRFDKRLVGYGIRSWHAVCPF